MTTLKSGSRGADVKTLQNALHLLADGIFGPLTLEAVKAFQTAHGLTPDGIVGTKTWAALGYGAGAAATTTAANKRSIKELIVHCTATPEGKDFTTAQIRACHLQRGFSDIGYHYVIYRDGSVHTGRDESVSGAHCTGHNAISIGVCYVGGCAADGKTPKDTRTEAQKKALRELLATLRRRYPKATIHGHYEFAAKACPSFSVDEYRDI